MKLALPMIVAGLAAPVMAEETRGLDAHEHGVGALNIAIDGNRIAMELHAPGADIVGFEYEATSDADKAAIEAALSVLSDPLSLFTLPAAAGCRVTSANAELEGDDEHGHEDHAEGEEHDDHGHEDHAEDKEHDDHGHDNHAVGEGHDDHGHDDHAEGEDNHTEFHAEYLLTCDDTGAATEIAFAYFDQFENALELEVQIVTSSGAQAFEVERADPNLDLSDAL